MTPEVQVLQVGGENWAAAHALPPGVHWTWLPASAAAEELPQETIDAALVCEVPAEAAVREALQEAVAPHTCYLALPQSAYEEQGQAARWLQDFRARTCAAILPEGYTAAWVEMLPRNYFRGQYGAKMGVEEADILPLPGAAVSVQGHEAIVFSGDFGPEMRQMLAWRNNIPTDKGMWLELFLEAQTEAADTDAAAPELALSVVQVACPPDMAVLRQWTFTWEDLRARRALLLDYEETGYFCFSLLAKGRGRVRVGPLHYRYARLSAGALLPGGRRWADEGGGELLSYFHPGNLRPPLLVYFSGYRTAEGFEGYWFMKGLGRPFLLLADPRLEGGQFYIGSPAYENKVESVIRRQLEQLQFTAEQLVLSGLSMGTYGAAYYAARLLPHAVVLGKPLLNLGTIAQCGQTIRPNDFDTAKDVLLAMTGGTDAACVRALDRRMWAALTGAELRRTRFFVAYMRQDDYDPHAYDDLRKKLPHLMLAGKGITGRHNDNTQAVVDWFLQQYRRLLARDFGET